MVRPDVVQRLLAVLLDNLADLRRYRSQVTLEALQSNRDVQHQVLHALYLAVQSSVDLALHVGADAALPQSATYQDAFRRLGEGGIVDRDLAMRLTGWAGLRNVLAHFYPVIDYSRVHAALGELEDLETFARLVVDMLEATPTPARRSD
jgi:uncharacterized protein YutE (UPF0331/DUF86 family)